MNLLDGKSKLRVLHVVRQFYPSVGGLENFVMELTKMQRQSGLDARVVTLDRLFHSDRPRYLPTKEEISGVPVHRIGFIGSYKYPIAPAVLKHLHGCDIVHVHGLDFFADFLALTKIFHGKKLVLSTHGGIFHTDFAKSIKVLYFNTVSRWTLSRYERVFACSQNDYTIFERICRARLELMQNGVDTSKYHGSSSRRPTLNFVFVGRFSVNKRLDRLIEVFSTIERALPGCRLFIIGRDSDESRTTLLTRIRNAGCDQSVQVMSGLADEEVELVLRGCSFFITASQYEGFGLALVEAASAGLVPIANRIPSSTEIVENLGTGLLVDFADNEAAAGHIVDFVQTISHSMVSARAQLILRAEEYSWVNTSERFADQYIDLMRPRIRRVLGVAITTGPRISVLSMLRDALNGREQLNIAFANAHSLNLTQQDNTFTDVMRRFLVLNDGIGVGLAFMMLHRRFPEENLNGTDFVPYFLNAVGVELRVYLLGGEPGVASLAEESARTKFPSHKFVGVHHGYLNDEESERVCREIKDTGADVVLVAMGSPLQENWIATNGHKTGAKLHFAVGGLFDFMSGRKQRAPRWVRSMKCEWVFRLMLEPSRLWRRYLIGNVTFIASIIMRRGHV